MSVINTNKAAMFAQTALKANESKLSVAMQQLSTAKRINSAKDDAAGLSISSRMTQWVRGLDMAIRNSGDAISLIQTAEGATDEITNMMQRMRELAVQAVNDTNTSMDRQYLDLEFQQLKQQIVAIANHTEWNGFPLLKGTVGEPVAPVPLLKVTSQYLSATELINPTPSITIDGADAGEIQTFTITLPPGDSDGNSITVNGITIDTLTPGDDESAIALKVKEALTASSDFGPNSGRLVSNNLGSVTITYSAKDRYQDPVLVDTTGSNLGLISATVIRPAITQITPQFNFGGKYLKAGTIVINTDATGQLLSTTFQTNRGETIVMNGVLDATNGTISFSHIAGENARVISEDLVLSLKDVDGAAVNISARETQLRLDIEGGIPALHSGDLRINGIDIDPSIASDDLLSPPENAAGSAIAKVAAINRKTHDSAGALPEIQTVSFSGAPTIPSTIYIDGIPVLMTASENTVALATAKIASALATNPLYITNSGREVSYTVGATSFQITYATSEGNVAPIDIVTTGNNLISSVEEVQKYTPLTIGTGVQAKVNVNVYTGQAMQSTASILGTITINGYATADIKTTINNPQKTRDDVVESINRMSYKTGVKAINTGSDSKGITLIAEDGRNIQVSLGSINGNQLFAQQVGLRAGVQSSTISLESKIPAPVVLFSSIGGDITRAGLTNGNFSANQAVYSTVKRSSVEYNQPQVSAINLGGTWTATSESAKVTINGTQFNYVIQSGDTVQSVKTGLISLINANQSLGVTASMGRNTSEILITARTPGIPFSLSTSKTSSTGTISNTTLIENTASTAKVLGENDLKINGTPIRATLAIDDILSSTVSLSSNPAASAIAIASVINASSKTTGVKAVANSAVSVGTKTDVSSTVTGKQHLFINGIEFEVNLISGEPIENRREKVFNAINDSVSQHGVKAIKNLKDSGITLESDGRNLSVWFDSNVQGLSAASFSLDKGDAVAQVTKVKSTGSSGTASIQINGQLLTTAAQISSADFCADMIGKINSSASLKNLEAVVDPNDSTSLLIRSTVPGSAFTVTGADSSNSTTLVTIGDVTHNQIGTNDVLGIFNATKNSNQAKTVYGTVKLIGIADDISKLPDVSDIVSKSSLHTGKPFNITTGANGFNSDSHFLDLGFQEGQFGGRASHDMDGPQVGRVAFQVGASAKQLVTIDIADFGKNGDITGLITSDVDKDLSQRNARINTREGASTALNMLDICMEKIDAARAVMGAMINRLDHIINNDSNISNNISASRSRIEDTDYASATSEMAKAQIIQQAGTAILAQANTNQQYVLKLLGG